MKKSIIKKTASLILVFAMILSVMVVASTGASAAIVESMGCISVGTSTDSYSTTNAKLPFITIYWMALSKATDYNIRVIDFNNQSSPTYSVQRVFTGVKKAGTNIKTKVYGVKPFAKDRYLISVTPLNGGIIIGDTAYVSPTSQKSNKVYSPYMKRKPSNTKISWYWEDSSWTYGHPELEWTYQTKKMKPSAISELYSSRFFNHESDFNKVTRKREYYDEFACRDDQAFQICITDKSDNNKKTYKTVNRAYEHARGAVSFKCDLYKYLKNNHKYRIEVRPYMNDDKGCQVMGPTIISKELSYKNVTIGTRFCDFPELKDPK